MVTRPLFAVPKVLMQTVLADRDGRAYNQKNVRSEFRVTRIILIVLIVLLQSKAQLEQHSIIDPLSATWHMAWAQEA